LERFDALRRLLDTVGWSNVTVPIEIDEHGPRLAHILKERIELDREYVNDLNELAAEREGIEEDIAAIEDFLAANALGDS
jgi:histidinol phosphatase-like PHP family hydrolase